MNDVIRLEGVCKYFGSTRAVDDLTMSIPKGQVVGFLGLNGAGKTTTMRLLTGLIRAEQGKINILNNDPWTMDIETRRKIGYLSEKDFPFPEMTLEHAAHFTSRFYPDWDDSYFTKLVSLLHIPLKSTYRILSRGQQRKFHLVLTLAPCPEVILLDDPAQGLDVTVRRELVQSILPLLQEGESTVLFSSHIMSDVERIANSVAIIHSGRLVLQDSLDHLKDRVRQIIIRGTPPANISNAIRYVHSGEETRITVLGLDQCTIDSLRESNTAFEVHSLGLEDLFVDVVAGENQRRTANAI